jgi:hypothetical protein
MQRQRFEPFGVYLFWLFHEHMGRMDNILKSVLLLDGFGERQCSERMEDKSADKSAVACSDVLLRAKVLRRYGVARLWTFSYDSHQLRSMAE